MADIKISELPVQTPAGTESVPLAIGTNGNGRAQVRDIAQFGYQTIALVTGTAITLSISDIGKWLRFTSSSLVTLTVPTTALAALPIGTTLNGIQAGSGKVSIVGSSGVTINKPATHNTSTRTQFSTFMLIKVADAEWDLIGDLESVA